MEFGYHVPRYDKYRDPDAWRELARTAESAGFDTLWRDDHVTLQAEIDYAGYPFGEPDWADIATPYCDVMQVLSFLAAVTEDVTLGSNICLAALRHPVLMTKQALTMDALSGGRFEFGVGTGWLASEFETLDVPFEERGSRTDEFLTLFERACEEGELAFEGPHHSFERTGFYPGPVGEGPRMWIGGKSGAAFRRTAEFGDGWTIVNDSPAEVAEARERLARAWADYDREGEPEIAVRRTAHLGESGPDGAMAGEPAEIAETVAAYAEAGTTHLALAPAADTVADERDQLRRLGEELLPRF
jgi:probable F420-dependent oxidoreductase